MLKLLTQKVIEMHTFYKNVFQMNILLMMDIYWVTLMWQYNIPSVLLTLSEKSILGDYSIIGLVQVAPPINAGSRQNFFPYIHVYNLCKLKTFINMENTFIIASTKHKMVATPVYMYTGSRQK